LSAGTTYYYKVSAYNNNYDESNMSSYAYTATLPATPTDVTATATSSSSITITWSSVSRAVNEYFVYRSTSSYGTYNFIGSSNYTTTSYTDTGLSANTPYYYKVSAFSYSYGVGSQSSYVSATTLSSGTGQGTESDPIPLTSGTWTNGSITSGDYVYYSFNVTSGNTYYVWWNDSYTGDGTKTGKIYVTGYYSNGTTAFSATDSAYYAPKSFTANSSGTFKLKVNSYGNGTFAIVYSTSSTRP